MLESMTSAQCVRITAADNHMDVERYITRSVDHLAVQRKLSQEMRKHIVDSLVCGARETFQWAKLQLSQLETTKQPILEQDLPAELARLALSTLGELYDSIFDLLVTSHGTARDLIVHVFSWLLFAQELFNVDTFLDVVANAVSWKTPTPQGLIDICRGFVYIDTQSNAVRLVHESARTYLRFQPLLDPHKAQTLISQSYLHIFKKPPLDDFKILQPSQRPYDYETAYFGHHISSLDPARPSDETTNACKAFLFSDHETGFYAQIWLETAKTTFDSLPPTHSQKAAMEVISSDTCSPLFPICALRFRNLSHLTASRLATKLRLEPAKHSWADSFVYRCVLRPHCGRLVSSRPAC